MKDVIQRLMCASLLGLSLYSTVTPAFGFDMETCLQRGISKKTCEAAAQIEGDPERALCNPGIFSRECVNGIGEIITARTPLGQSWENMKDYMTDSAAALVRKTKESMAKHSSRPMCIKQGEIEFSKHDNYKDVGLQKQLTLSDYGMKPTYVAMWVEKMNNREVDTETQEDYSLSLQQGYCYPISDVSLLGTKCAYDGCWKEVRLKVQAAGSQGNKFELGIVLKSAQ